MASLSELYGLLESNVIEAKFIRRRPKPGSAATRRAFITNNAVLLNSPRGKVTLRYTGLRDGSTGLGFNVVAKNLVLAWDLLWQEYRLFGAEGSQVVTVIPVTTEKEIESFWKYFDDNIMILSPEDKLKFMNS